MVTLQQLLGNACGASIEGSSPSPLLIVLWQSGQLRFSHKEVGKPVASSNLASTTRELTASIIS